MLLQYALCCALYYAILHTIIYAILYIYYYHILYIGLPKLPVPSVITANNNTALNPLQTGITFQVMMMSMMMMMMMIIKMIMTMMLIIIMTITMMMVVIMMMYRLSFNINIQGNITVKTNSGDTFVVGQ